ncbi:MAG: GlxA family transcriptional regulator [Neomegalonema sp.]|nr:GlxA family transcriptional regulator [Neomegalonema sp.]
MIAFAAAIEPLRVANRIAQRDQFSWTIASDDGRPVPCSNGVLVGADCALKDVERNAIIMVVGGVDVQRAASKPALDWLRRQARRGAALGGICTGAYLLARAGLLEGRRCTIHWENQPSMAEDFPELDVTNHIYEIDRGRYTCAGGVAASDMMLRIVAEVCGEEVAGDVADLLIHAPVRGGREEQRASMPARIGVRHPKLTAILQTMERNLEEPVSPATLAKEAGMSTRQLERLFRRYLNRSPKRYYMEIRLQRARQLLLQTDMSVINVALACGFTSPSHFSKCYRHRYERTPYRERGAPTAEPSGIHLAPTEGVAGDLDDAGDAL